MKNLQKKIINLLSFKNISKECHPKSLGVSHNGTAPIGIFGTPNVGKSVIFNSLTGAKVTVSNYSGTTVDISRGKAKLFGKTFDVVDSPGMYSMLPITEEERVARMILLKDKFSLLLHVVDANNLERMLPLTLQLIEAGLPVILDINMMDEAERNGRYIDLDRLEKDLNIPVIGTVATTGRGMDVLKKRIFEYVSSHE